MRILLCFLLLSACSPTLLRAQSNPPWRQPLMIARSADGAQFGAAAVFQDSAGVPSALRWKGDTLLCVFQWFRLPENGPAWDRVAVKVSADKGQSWSAPVPVLFSGLPAGYQRPFDPTLALLPDGRLRLYFSSSKTLPPPGQDSIINTYSAVSSDGIHFSFEPDARVDHPTGRVIDPAVAFFKNSWHYIAPVGAPQQGAYHYLSPDGLHFSAVPNILSDQAHNWTGNYLVDSPGELRFYGSGANIWYNKTVNGGIWDGFVPTNIQGGDPTVVKTADNSYLMIYVGKPYTTPVAEAPEADPGFEVFANRDASTLFIHALDMNNSEGLYFLYDIQGRLLYTGAFSKNAEVNILAVSDPVLFLRIAAGGKVYVRKVGLQMR